MFKKIIIPILLLVLLGISLIIGINRYNKKDLTKVKVADASITTCRLALLII